MGCPRQCREALGRDRLTAPGAWPIGPRVQSAERGLDLAEMLRIPLTQSQVALLLEDLAGGRGLGPVRHRARRDDSPGKLQTEPLTLGEERGARIEVGF